MLRTFLTSIAVAWCGGALAQDGSFLNGNCLHGHLKDYRAGRGQLAVGYVMGVHDATSGHPKKDGAFKHLRT
jgi:hypothetical protein